MADDAYGEGGSPFDASPVQPQSTQAPAVQAPPLQPAPYQPQPGSLRSSILKKPLDANSLGGGNTTTPGYPPRFR
jgi:hypothetical protein